MGLKDVDGMSYLDYTLKAEETRKDAQTAKTMYGSMPLKAASARGDEVSVKALIATGYQNLEESDSGWTPLLFSANNGHEGCVKALLAAGANKEATNTVSQEMRVMTL
jgi:ankyrin repeat protein